MELILFLIILTQCGKMLIFSSELRPIIDWFTLLSLNYFAVDFKKSSKTTAQIPFPLYSNEIKVFSCYFFRSFFFESEKKKVSLCSRLTLKSGAWINNSSVDLFLFQNFIIFFKNLFFWLFLRHFYFNFFWKSSPSLKSWDLNLFRLFYSFGVRVSFRNYNHHIIPLLLHTNTFLLDIHVFVAIEPF